MNRRKLTGKSANASFAWQSILPELEKLEKNRAKFWYPTLIPHIIHPQYLARVMYEFLTVDKPYQKSYQPIAIYNNNIGQPRNIR